ncbi:O-antigen ligase family protein [Nocardioides currus]|uniref:O-antigen ligase-related domain-containing protein n=1 Tax=Nocardioides currus TaxID=2133958 RepID=A0A2R7Z352_9ACTN|nr:O-antigen ligase family protein [Nocardioides currus]PUA83030.1 hypothetical protein C7S10_04950 [Nocardioides currus]
MNGSSPVARAHRRLVPGPRGAAQAGTWYGALWSVVICLDYFLISSPLVFEPVFDESLRRALLCTSIACLVSITRLQRPRLPWSVACFLGFAVASIVWSINRAATLHFVGLYVVLGVLAVVVAANVAARVIAHGVVLGGVLVVVTSIYAYWQEMPGSDVAPGSSGVLAGVGTNRNILAYTMILAFAFAVSFVPRRWLLRVGWSLAIATILTGLLLAESATGIASSAALAGMAIVVGSRDRLIARGRPPGWRYWVALVAILLTLVAAGLGWYEALHRDLQRDFSLTGRVQIWEAAWETSTTHARLVGEGWGAVWPHPWRAAPANGPFFDISQYIGHPVTHGHNSLFDLLPELGLVGVFLFAMIYLQSVVRGLRLRRSTATPAARETGRVAFLGVLALALAGVTEPLSTVPLGFFVAVLLVATVHREVVPAPEPSTPATTPDRVESAS